MAIANYFQTFKASIARIYHPSSGMVVGAGFLVSDRHLLTCAHVVAEALSIAQNTPEAPAGKVDLDFPLIAPGQIFSAKVVFWRPVQLEPLTSPEQGEDIAGLKLDGNSPVGSHPVRLVSTTDTWKHPFRIFGFPNQREMGVWASGVLRDKLANGWVQMEDIKVPGYSVEPGFSGAPVWDEELAGVVGIAVAAERKREEAKTSFLIPTSILSSAWLELGQWIAEHSRSRGQTPYTLPSFRQVQLRARKDYFSVLCAKYEAVYNQLSYTLNEGDKVSLRQNIKAIEQEIEQVEQEIRALLQEGRRF
ncbi:MAG: trypsin-like peptidase domain-containing protein [Symploca sp. SIO1A3]|nr:trypsin-like peptidase domain-containing protein [Symploca sp. SIO1A3]